MAILHLGPSTHEFPFQGQLSWTESLEPGEAGTSLQVKFQPGDVTPPDEGLVCLKPKSGGKYYAAWYEGIKVDDAGAGARTFSIQTLDFATFLTNLKIVKGYSAKGRLDDHLRALTAMGGAANPDWPFKLLDYACPVTDSFEYQADGVFLQTCFQELAERTKNTWYCTFGTWTNPAALNVPISVAQFLPLGYSTPAPHDIRIIDGPPLCAPMNTIYGVSYELGPLGPSRVIFAGKNAVLSLVDRDIPATSYPTTIETPVPAGSTLREFPLLKGATRIDFARVSYMGEPLKLYRLREEDPTNFTDENGDPVDALVRVSADPPLLVFPPDPAPPPGGGDAFLLTVNYATESVICKKVIEGRAAQLGASLGVPFPVERDYLIRRDDIDLIEDGQQLANSEAERLSQRTFNSTFKTKAAGWNAGAAYLFEDTVKERSSRQVARRVQRTLIVSDGQTDILETTVQASNQPIVTSNQRAAQGYKQSLNPRSASLRVS